MPKLRKEYGYRLEGRGHAQANQAITQVIWFPDEPVWFDAARWNTVPKGRGEVLPSRPGAVGHKLNYPGER